MRAAITSGRLNCESVLTIADAQRVTPAFRVALRNRGLVDKLPTQAHGHLWKIRFLNTFKNRRLREQALEAIGQLNAIGVEPMLLTGSASLLVKTLDEGLIRSPTTPPVIPAGCRNPAPWTVALGYSSGSR